MICRLCLVESNSDFVNIFDDNGVQLEIADIISKHFWFTLSKEDSISDKLCSSCWTRVASFHEFYCFIEDAQKKLVNNLKSNSSSSWSSSDLLPVALDDLKKEDIYDKLNEDTRNDCSSKYLVLSDYVETFIENNDPLTYEKLKLERMSYDGILQSDIPKNFITSNVTQSSCENSLTEQYNKLRKICKKKKSTQKKKFEEEDDQIVKFIKLECDICFDNFKCFLKLKNHMKQKHKHPKGYVVCCNKKISRKDRLLDHINLHKNPEAFSCTMCNKIFSQKQSLRDHISRIHNKDESKVFTCDQCQKSFSYNALLKRHKLTHTSPEENIFQCDLCHKSYPTKTILDAHIRNVHKKLYDLVCDICGKRIKGKVRMDEHILEHNGITEPKVQCQTCGSWLKNERILKIHMQLHAEALLGLKCNICKKQMSSKCALREHVKYVHENQRNFKCTVCEKAFKKKKTLKEHITTHTGDTLYTCTFCPKTFNANSNLYTHRKRAHPKEWEELNKQRMNPISNTTST